MSLIGRLDLVQLEIVMHLANGKQIDEIATDMHRSRTDINRRIKLARSRCQAHTIPHLVSIAVASGDLVWENEARTLNGLNGHSKA